MAKICLTLDAEDHHTGFSRALAATDVMLHLGDEIDVHAPFYDARTTAQVTGFDDAWVLVRVDWDRMVIDQPLLDI